MDEFYARIAELAAADRIGEIRRLVEPFVVEPGFEKDVSSDPNWRVDEGLSPSS
jgi:hypothetical protein